MIPVHVDPHETIDDLNHGFRLIQRRKGHRAASDDMLLAGFALPLSGPRSQLLELGCGKGTVSLMLQACNPTLKVYGIEALAQSYDLALRNRALNGVEDRMTLEHGDLRELDLSRDTLFDLVIGAPPFMPLGSGVLPKDEQRRAGRFELKGGIEEYFCCAQRHLRPTGRALMLMDGQGELRAIKAAETSGLYVSKCIRIRPRPGRPPTYALIEASPLQMAPVMNDMVMRGESGAQWSEAYADFRKRLGYT